MKLPNGVGDLQKGERYTNMDFLFFLTLCGCGIDTLNISYDIACQWHKNLWERMSAMPSKLHLDHATKSVRFFMPKFHLPAHILKCQTMFSFNFSKNIGHMDGEAPERGWSNINPVASSTKEMGLGSWRDTLDNHFGDWNWKKVVGLSSTLLRKIKEAKEESEVHQIAFEELNGALRLETMGLWMIMIKHWEDNPNDSSVTNPFEAKVIRDALEEIRQCLRLRDYMYTFKRDWLHGQSANTRAQNAVSRVEARATAAAEKYCAAHMALLSLAHVLGKVGWDHKHQVLDRKNDIRGMSVPKRGESEGQRQLSWIWLVEGVGDDEDEVIQDTRARSMRWAEEVGLLQEEMRRVSCFLRWHASWWSMKIVECTLGTAADNEGLGTYACYQAQLRDDLADCFEKKWAAHHPLTVADTRCNNMRSADSAPKSMAASEAELDLYLPELPLP
ncbi:hypothetical protein BDR03DRAFT_1019255 [Suillus americanus]|nr:hypothetical protein BDR03DRAFT_1019255 [Suillus americanus]